MHLSTLSDWLTQIASIHTAEIELGLERVASVAQRLQVVNPTIPVITVAGTNGKGSTVAGLQAIYRAAHYRVGTFTSPFLFKPNEQVCLNGREVSDAELCHALEKVDLARGDISLTPFEFFTLAALVIFKTAELDVLLLEVGLGGRLDAVNIIDADVALVTSISIDHVDWLGPTRESIAKEKAGIFRKNKPAVYGDTQPPQTLIDYAAQLGTRVFYQNKDFHFHESNADWSWSHQSIHYPSLPITPLLTQNMANVLMAVTLLQQQLPVEYPAIKSGLAEVSLPGRIQIIPGRVMEIHDVSHNPAAISLLAQHLHASSCQGKTRAVFSMLADKDIAESIAVISEQIDQWYVAPLANKRAAKQEALTQAFQQTKIDNVIFSTCIKTAYQSAVQQAKAGDRIVVFGSFHTVAAVHITMPS